MAYVSGTKYRHHLRSIFSCKIQLEASFFLEFGKLNSEKETVLGLL